MEEVSVDDQTRQFFRGRVVCFALAALSVAGCASHGPLASAKVSHAERAVEEAQQVGAATSAPVELRAAQDKLTAAQAAMAKGNHDRAIRDAEQAALDGEYARALAANQRANTIADEMGQYIKVLRQELERLPK
ncbi:MAG: hypothetical protein DME01_00085 [Candidatus Rokuibacteriota bacterium]|nr:MAG: hypothetical protein DME01_00085 [Candidatus Rokubacteria bacterium]